MLVLWYQAIINQCLDAISGVTDLPNPVPTLTASLHCFVGSFASISQESTRTIYPNSNPIFSRDHLQSEDQTNGFQEINVKHALFIMKMGCVPFTTSSLLTFLWSRNVPTVGNVVVRTPRNSSVKGEQC